MSSAATRFNPLDHKLTFLRPELVTMSSAWAQHIPFAYALIEMCRPTSLVELGTHSGNSYCAFCQAIVALKLQTRCTAVDTWQGDEHSGKYDAIVLNSLKAFHDPRYSSFSTLRQTTFDQARSEFADGSIDLLHIDGLHSYDAVKHDFDSWLPKMSSCGVVIMHDTMERTADFGVYKLWEEISPRYPNLNFRHGHGLGVLAVGAEAPAPLLDFLKLAEDPAAREEILTFFEYVGMMMEPIRVVGGLIGAIYELHFMHDQRKRLLNEQVHPVTIQSVNANPVEMARQLWPRLNEVVLSEFAARKIPIPSSPR